MFGTDDYSYEVDIWSAGCIMAEMLTGKALFPAKDEFQLVQQICWAWRTTRACQGAPI